MLLAVTKGRAPKRIAAVSRIDSFVRSIVYGEKRVGTFSEGATVVLLAGPKDVLALHQIVSATPTCVPIAEHVQIHQVDLPQIRNVATTL